eukprot:998219-Prymnesium_polylepis.2
MNPTRKARPARLADHPVVVGVPLEPRLGDGHIVPVQGGGVESRRRRRRRLLPAAIAHQPAVALRVVGPNRGVKPQQRFRPVVVALVVDKQARDEVHPDAARLELVVEGHAVLAVAHKLLLVRCGAPPAVEQVRLASKRVHRLESRPPRGDAQPRLDLVARVARRRDGLLEAVDVTQLVQRVRVRLAVYAHQMVRRGRAELEAGHHEAQVASRCRDGERVLLESALDRVGRPAAELKVDVDHEDRVRLGRAPLVGHVSQHVRRETIERGQVANVLDERHPESSRVWREHAGRCREHVDPEGRVALQVGRQEGDGEQAVPGGREPVQIRHARGGGDGRGADAGHGELQRPSPWGRDLRPPAR